VVIVDRAVPHYRRALYERLLAGGAATYTIVAAARPAERMHTVPWPNDWPWIDAPVREIPGTGGRSVWQWGAAKAGFSRRYDTVLMMANPRDPALWICAVAARLTGKRVLMWTHGTKRVGRARSDTVRRLWHRLASGLLFYGHHGKVCSAHHGDPIDHSYVVYNSLDYGAQRRLRESITDDDVEAVRRTSFAAPDGPAVACISRLRPEKRVDLLLEAAARLGERGHPVRVLIIGDGPTQGDLEALSRRLGLADRVCFCGGQYEEADIAPLLCAADLCVVPAALGLSAMHALAYGVPVISHDDIEGQGPEFEAVIPGVTGDLFRAGDLDSLVECMEAWLAPAPRRAAARAACIEMIERFYNPEAQATVIERAIEGTPPDDLAIARTSKQ
jgi:glycosyltransferase involved in cell wall biosynthesis